MRATLSRRGAVYLVALAAAAAFAMSTPAAIAEDIPLAINGYDPVAYFTLGKPTKGVPEFAYDWDDHRYLFVSAEHRDRFKAEPVRYAPQFGNYCAMALAKGKIVVANPENWLVSDGKLFREAQCAARRLLAVAERRIEDSDVLAGNHHAAPSAWETAVSDCGPDCVTSGRRGGRVSPLRVVLLD